MKCIYCGNPMKQISHLQKNVDNSTYIVDICENCNFIWFDKNEQSVMKTDSLVIFTKELVDMTNHNNTLPKPNFLNLSCPRCGHNLIPQNNLTGGQSFSYGLCSEECGILMAFEDFLHLHTSIIESRIKDKECDYDSIVKYGIEPDTYPNAHNNRRNIGIDIGIDIGIGIGIGIGIDI